MARTHRTRSRLLALAFTVAIGSSTAGCLVADADDYPAAPVATTEAPHDAPQEAQPAP